MDYLSWDLSILSRATAYENLSRASQHVGLSQPQLSRIVAKLEANLGVTLLDRESRRKSSWTPAAYRLAEIYQNTVQAFRAEISVLAAGLTPRELRVGTLEGLVPAAMAFCKEVLDRTGVMVMHLDVLDTGPLEELFAKNELDLIFTAHDLGPRKWRYVRVLGYQTVDAVKTGDMQIYSMFEYAAESHKGLPTEKAFVSNSLRVRQDWLARHGGRGTQPSKLTAKPTRKKQEVTAMVVAHDHMPPAFWDEIQAFLRPEG